MRLSAEYRSNERHAALIEGDLGGEVGKLAGRCVWFARRPSLEVEREEQVGAARVQVDGDTHAGSGGGGARVRHMHPTQLHGGQFGVQLIRDLQHVLLFAGGSWSNSDLDTDSDADLECSVKLNSN